MINAKGMYNSSPRTKMSVTSRGCSPVMTVISQASTSKRMLTSHLHCYTLKVRNPIYSITKLKKVHKTILR